MLQKHLLVVVGVGVQRLVLDLVKNLVLELLLPVMTGGDGDKRFDLLLVVAVDVVGDVDLANVDILTDENLLALAAKLLLVFVRVVLVFVFFFQFVGVLVGRALRRAFVRGFGLWLLLYFESTAYLKNIFICLTVILSG